MTLKEIIEEIKNINKILSKNNYEYLSELINKEKNYSVKNYKILIEEIKKSSKFSDEQIKNNLINFFNKFIISETTTSAKELNTIPSLKDNIKNFPYKNILFKGVPGTGKSKKIDDIIEYKLGLKEKKDNILKINIHSASSNADLMQGIAISTENQQISYKEKKGLILHHIENALYNPYEPFVLVLEEIQENSLNELIGDLIYLIEPSKRAEISKLENLKMILLNCVSRWG